MPNILETILPLLTGPSRAALLPPGLQDLMQVTGTPPFVPGQEPLSTQAPFTTLTPPTFQSPPPETGLGVTAAQMALQDLINQPRFEAPQPKAPGVGERLLQSIPEALAIFATGLNPTAGREALGVIGAQREGRRAQEQAGRRQLEFNAERQRQEQIDLLRENVSEERRKAAERRAEDREEERYIRQQQQIDQKIGAQTDLELTKEKFRLALGQAKEAEAERKAIEAQQRADEKEVRLRTGQIYDDYKGGVPRQVAKQIAEFEVSGTPLSREGQKVYERATRTKQALGGVGPKGQQFIGQFETVKGDYANSVGRGDKAGESFQLKKLEALMKKAPPDVEVGYDPTGRWPYAKIRGTNQPSTQPQTATGYSEQEKQYAQRFNIPLDQARRELSGK